MWISHDSAPYIDWALEGGHEQEIELLDKMESLGPLFADMLFKKGTRSHGLIKCQTAPMESEELTDVEMDLPPELDYFSYLWFHTRIEALDDCEGYFSGAEQTICISPEAMDDDVTLLHEMIHLHEFVINELPIYFHDMLYWALYTDLRKGIPRLDEIITSHAHLLTGTSLYAEGGLHDILFLLKSFDLDMRMGYPLGTVFGYGKSDEFSSYSYDND